ncbi:MAG: DUF2959 domain-containing protein [Campylobacterota bacterium]|nr:DUF2959 domain-containing protein [Campylobacterota bacterium]
MRKLIYSVLLSSFALLTISGCANKIYYAGMEKVGVHKRDIMVSRIENVQDSQKDTQDEFKSALEQFGSLVTIENSDLKSAYEKFDNKYEDAKEAAQDLSDHINKLQNVSLALFEEWEDELDLYQNQKLKIQSQKKLNATRSNYKTMMKAMKRSEKSMEPILATFQDNVLTLKHSLNAQAIGTLQGEFKSLKKEIRILNQQMNLSIKESSQFIQQMD